MCIKMANRNKTIVTAIFSSIAGAVIGGVVVWFATVYFLGAFFSDSSALASSNQLNFNIWALESIRNGDHTKAIEQLEREAKVNLITVGAYEEYISSKTNKRILKSISNAKQYFEKHPTDYINEDEQVLIEQAYQKGE